MKRRVIRAFSDERYAVSICNQLRKDLSANGVSEVHDVYGVGDENYLNICVDLMVNGHSAALYCIYDSGEAYVNISPIRTTDAVVSIVTWKGILEAGNRLTEIYEIANQAFQRLTLRA